MNQHEQTGQDIAELSEFLQEALDLVAKYKRPNVVWMECLSMNLVSAGYAMYLRESGPEQARHGLSRLMDFYDEDESRQIHLMFPDTEKADGLH